MSKRYPGGFLTGDEPTVNQQGADGIWTLDQQAAYQSQNEWPLSQYQISRSLRFNSADSAYLSRTPASAGNRKIWTWSGWVKRTNLGTTQTLFGCRLGQAATIRSGIQILSDQLNYFSDPTGSAGTTLQSTMVLRDTSAWYHIVVAADVTQSTASDRLKMYVNGVQITSFSTENYPVQNSDMGINKTELHYIGMAEGSGGTNKLDGYLADINFVDGQALTPSDFGRDNPITGVWEPLPQGYVGTYGTNGFHLTFADNSGETATTIGADSSGNGNNWTPSGISVSPGAGNDSVVDTPTPYGVDTGAGGEVRGNYATLNPLSLTTGASLSNGNLTVTTSNNPSGNAYSTIAIPSSGKWYWEYVGTSTGQYCFNGVSNEASLYAWYFGVNGYKYVDGEDGASYGATYGTNDVIGVAVDADSNEITFYKNGSSQGAISYDFSRSTFFASFTDGASSFGTTQQVNFGQRPFAYTAPSGFKALCTTNLPTPTIADGSEYFNTVLYEGNGTTQAITGVGFQPDFVWIKERNGTGYHALFDAVRGVTKALYSNDTLAEGTGTAFTSFDSDGFTLSLDINQARSNDNTDIYVAWNWNAGGSNATNTDGTITSTVRANPTAGFSIVSYTGNGSTSPYPTVGHGLGVAPQIYIVKRRDNTGNWVFWHTLVDGSLDFMYLNTTAANANSTLGAVPTSTVMTVGGAFANTNGATYIAYCFAEVEGYSKFGSYTGNGSTDGPFVYCGFRPAFVLYKVTSNTGSWSIFDNKRDSYNEVVRSLSPNLSDAETTTGRASDFLSNGFKWRNAVYGNSSGETYIFAAFAENPFKYSLAR